MHVLQQPNDPPGSLITLRRSDESIIEAADYCCYLLSLNLPDVSLSGSFSKALLSSEMVYSGDGVEATGLLELTYAIDVYSPAQLVPFSMHFKRAMASLEFVDVVDAWRFEVKRITRVTPTKTLLRNQKLKVTIQPKDGGLDSPSFVTPWQGG